MRRRKSALIKSNNPHLAGGEKWKFINMLSWNFDRIELLSKFITTSAKNVGFMGKSNDYTSVSYNP